MGRYDRIARLDPPSRNDAFDGWLALRDLEGRERETELGRRARLHFLALRPARRLLIRGFEKPSSRSLERQLSAARDQVERLPAGDPERAPLAHYLDQVAQRSPAGLVPATIEVGAAAEAAGYLYAAEEFYRTALDLAEAHGLDDHRIVALHHIGHVQCERQEGSAAAASIEDSAVLAESLGHVNAWARSREALADIYLRSGEANSARAITEELDGHPHAAGEPLLRAMAAASRCGVELAQGDAETALELGWTAASLLSGDDEARARVLMNMAAAFRQLALHAAAGSCYEIVARSANWPKYRLRAQLEYAIVAAEGGDASAFTARRASVLDTIRHRDRPIQAVIHLGLGRGALLVDHTEDGRDHIRQALEIARDLEADALLKEAQALLSVLEEPHRLEPPAGSASQDATRIAGRISDLAGGPVG